MDMTDVLQHRKQPEQKVSDGNPKASALTVVGYVILIAGVLLALFVGIANENFMGWVYAGSTILFGVMCGVFFIGFGEVIKILHGMSKKPQ